MNKGRFFEKSILPGLIRFSHQPELTAIKDGFSNLLPYSFITGLFILLIKAWLPTALSSQYSGQSLSLIPVWYALPLFAYALVFSISSQLSKLYAMEWIPVLMVSLIAYALLVGIPEPRLTLTAMVFAPVSTLFATGLLRFIHTLMAKLAWPTTIPSRVKSSLNEISGLAITVTLLIVLRMVFPQDIPDYFTNVFGLLLDGTNTFWFFLILNSLNTTIWYFGFHGTNVLSNLVVPITTMTLMLNAQAYLFSEPLPYLFAGLMHTLYGNYVIFNAINLWIHFAARSKHLKELVKTSRVPSLFNINESIIYGVPLVKNKIVYRAFLIANALNMVIVIQLMQIGWLERFWLALPFVIPAFAQAGIATLSWNSVFVWFALLIMDLAIIFPFLRKHDRQLNQAEVTEAS